MIDPTGNDQSWWPDLTGKTVAILASGPSMNRAQCDLVRSTDWYAIAINETWRIAPWAAALYGCDWEWWKAAAPKPEEYSGMRITGTMPRVKGRGHLPNDMAWQGELLRFAPVRAGMTSPMWDGREIGAGSNSAFQAANLVARCKAARLVLLGVDCHSPNVHHHPPHSHQGAAHQKPSTMATWIKSWENAAPEFKSRGIECINCSPSSAVKAFKRVALSDLIAA